MNCLVHNHTLTNVHASANEVLDKYPRGAYTTMRTLHVNKEWHIVQYDAHVLRMQQSCEILKMELNANLMKTNIAASIKFFLQLFGDHGDLKITLLVNQSTTAAQELDYYTHVTILPDRPSKSVIVDVRRGSRVEIKGKDSVWVKLREQVMSQKTLAANEVLLCEEDGRVREGCSSNFFYVKNQTVYTANEGILTGTIQLLVYEVCKEMNIALQFVVPCIKDMTECDECFITSTSRLVLPIQTLVLDAFASQFVTHATTTGEYMHQLPTTTTTSISQQLLQGVIAKLLAQSSIVYTD